MRSTLVRLFWYRCTGAVAFLAGVFAFYYGFVMTFLVPGTPGEGLFEKCRVLLGVLPLTAGLLSLCAAGWLLFRSFPRQRLSLSDSIALCIGTAAGIILFLFLMAGVFARAPF